MPQYNSYAVSSPGSLATLVPIGPVFSAGQPAFLATGDFNGDGFGDIVFETAAGLYIWEMEGTAILGSSVFESLPAAGLTFLGGADLNGDGKTDLVWENSTALQTVIWWGGIEADSTTISDNGQVPQTLGDFFGPSVSVDYGTSSQVNLDDVSASSFNIESNINGVSTLSYASSTTGVTAALSAAPAPASGVTRVSSLTGSAYDDILTGNNLVGTLNGGGGNDTLIAGSAGDTLVAGSGYDVMKAGSAHDTIDLAAGNGGTMVQGFTTGSTGDALAFSGLGTSGTVNISQAKFAEIAGVNAAGVISVETLDGTTTTIGTLPSGFSLLASGDFNGDGVTDYWLRNTSNDALDIWYSNGQGGYTLESFSPPGLSVEAFGDFNGDGKEDVIWAVAGSGAPDLWLSTGSADGFANEGCPFPANYGIIGTARLPGSAVDDPIEQYSNGATFLCVMNAAATSNYTPYGNAIALTASSSSPDQVLASGAFGGPGTSYILWYVPQSGSLALASLVSSGMSGLTPVGPSFSSKPTLLAAADFNGDGITDVAFASGTNVYVWDMNSAGSPTLASPNIQNSAGLKFIGASDLSGNGCTDLIWQNQTTNQIVVWWDGLQANATTIAANSAIATADVSGLFAQTGTTIQYGATSAVSLDATAMSNIDLVNQVTGASTASYATDTTGVTVTLAANATPNDGLTHIANIVGSAYHDVLTGNAGNNILTGGGGSNIMVGGGGTDTYVMSATDAIDTINNVPPSGGTSTGTLELPVGYNSIWLKVDPNNSNNLDIDILGTSQQTVLQNAFSGSSAGAGALAEIVSGDATPYKLDAALNTLIQAMATYQTNNMGFNPQATGTTMPTNTTLDNAIAAAWHH